MIIILFAEIDSESGRLERECSRYWNHWRVARFIIQFAAQTDNDDVEDRLVVVGGRKRVRNDTTGRQAGSLLDEINSLPPSSPLPVVVSLIYCLGELEKQLERCQVLNIANLFDREREGAGGGGYRITPREELPLVVNDRFVDGEEASVCV